VWSAVSTHNVVLAVTSAVRVPRAVCFSIMNRCHQLVRVSANALQLISDSTAKV
jgi:hypothetical protein